MFLVKRHNLVLSMGNKTMKKTFVAFAVVVVVVGAFVGAVKSGFDTASQNTTPVQIDEWGNAIGFYKK